MTAIHGESRRANTTRRDLRTATIRHDVSSGSRASEPAEASRDCLLQQTRRTFHLAPVQSSIAVADVSVTTRPIDRSPHRVDRATTRISCPPATQNNGAESRPGRRLRAHIKHISLPSGVPERRPRMPEETAPEHRLGSTCRPTFWSGDWCLPDRKARAPTRARSRVLVLLVAERCYAMTSQDLRGSPDGL
jgi:hypothetical protein